MASSQEQDTEYRERMLAQGMRPIEIWVPDINAPGFAEEARRQSLLVADSPLDQDDQGFVDAASEWPEDD